MTHTHTQSHTHDQDREERYHGKAGKQRRCPAGSLQLSPAQVQLPPRERLQGVLVQTHRVAPRSSRSQSQAERAEMTSFSPNTRPTTSPAAWPRSERAQLEEVASWRNCGSRQESPSLSLTPPPASLAECVERVVPPPPLLLLHLTLPIMPRAAEKKNKNPVIRSPPSRRFSGFLPHVDE